MADPGESDLALAAIVDHVSHGRSRASRPGSNKELAATRSAARPRFALELIRIAWQRR